MIQSAGDHRPLIIVGASTRAAAQSAICAGYHPWCIDLFADRDLRMIAPVKRCEPDSWPMGVLNLLRDAPDAPVLLTGAMENHLPVVKAIETSRPIFGIGSAAMGQLRERENQHALFDDLCKQVESQHHRDSTKHQLLACHRVREGFLPDEVAHYDQPEQWVVKAIQRTGGRSIRFWNPGDAMMYGEYAERFISGRPISGVFRAEQGVIRFAAFTEQLIGDDHFGARAFQYVGNIGPIAISDSSVALFRFAEALVGMDPPLFTDGVFGIDAIRSQGGAWDDLTTPAQTFVLEINPRFPAGAEVWERATGRSVLNDISTMDESARVDLVVGKAIVYAKQACVTSELYAFFTEHEVADVPDAGVTLSAGEPVCTVLFHASTREACATGLRERAAEVYTRLGTP